MPSRSKPRTALPARARGPARRLTLRELNRATLARQLLLDRAPVDVSVALTRVAGLQAQLPGPPNVGLWSRLADYTRSRLADLLEKHNAVRAPLLRGTLHLVTAADYAQFRAVVAPMLHRSFATMPATRLQGIDPFALAAEARPFLEAAPRTQDEVREFLGARHPQLDVRMAGHAVRLHLPLVQVPERGAGSWDFPGMPRFALAESWIRRPLATSPNPRPLICRYLAAFGPATVRDFQTWSGLGGAREEFERLRPELQTCTDDGGRELFDLRDAAVPDGTEPAPVRFLPEYDNILLAHHDRRRIVADEHRARVFLPGLRVAATLLVDGFVSGTWKLERVRTTARVVVSPFRPLGRAVRAATETEGEQLARFLEPEASAWAVSFAR